MSCSWYLLHGFWGEPSDFDALINEMKSQRPQDDFYPLSILDIEEVSFSQWQPPKSWSLIVNDNKATKNFLGYSLGGRIFTDLAFNDRFDKWINLQAGDNLFLLSSGFGLDYSLALKERVEWEDQMLEDFSKKTLEESWASWSEYPIFQGGKDKIRSKTWSKQDIINVFDGFRLSKQNYYYEAIKDNSKVEVFLGEHDSKYLEMYQDMAVNTVPNSGHRIIHDQPGLLAKQLLEKTQEKL